MPARSTLAGLLVMLVAAPAAAQRDGQSGTISIVIGAEPTLPVPTLSLAKANTDVASLLFLPLARLGRRMVTTDEKSYEPALARSWRRTDSVTLVFELDERARWHDGTPVTPRDVVWSVNRARDSTVSPTYALLLRNIASVTATGPRQVTFRFRHAYGDQMFDAVSNAVPLPAHLLDTIPAARLASSAYVSRPVGNGPFRWGRLEPGRQLELAAVPDFFLGAPKLHRVVFLVVRAAEAQLNLVLDGTADAYEASLLPRQITPIMEQPHLDIKTQSSFSVGYLLFNQRAAGNRSQPHPILADREVRHAISLAIDRQRLVRSVFGPYASIVDGPMGQATWIRRHTAKGPAFDPAEARRILASRGWRDSDGDGILDKDGTRLTLRLIYPGTSTPRVSMAEPIQAMLRGVGIQIELQRLDGPVWAERRGKGEFDIDFSQATLVPTPAGLVQSWSCAGVGGSNVGSACNPSFDEAYAAAVRATGSAAAERWHDAIAILQRDYPAVFLYSPAQALVVHRRYRDVSIRPDGTWTDLWRWSVDPARRIARDQR